MLNSIFHFSPHSSWYVFLDNSNRRNGSIGIVEKVFGERMYNPIERKKEIEEHTANLDVYIDNIQATLSKYGIITKNQRDILRKECEQQLSIHSTSYNTVSSKAFDTLVGVPLGALITALLFKVEGTDFIMSHLFVLVFLGLMIVCISNILKKITYYSDNHFKDQYLLNVLNELEYIFD